MGYTGLNHTPKVGLDLKFNHTPENVHSFILEMFFHIAAAGDAEWKSLLASFGWGRAWCPTWNGWNWTCSNLERLCSGDFPKGNAVVLQRWDRLGTWKHRQLVIFKEWRYSGWWFQTMNCLFSMSYMGYIILPIDELHHFSRWAHCTTSQIENEGISMRLALISPANC